MKPRAMRGRMSGIIFVLILFYGILHGALAAEEDPGLAAELLRTKSLANILSTFSNTESFDVDFTREAFRAKKMGAPDGKFQIHSVYLGDQAIGLQLHHFIQIRGFWGYHWTHFRRGEWLTLSTNRGLDRIGEPMKIGQYYDPIRKEPYYLVAFSSTLNLDISRKILAIKGISWNIIEGFSAERVQFFYGNLVGTEVWIAQGNRPERDLDTIHFLPDRISIPRMHYLQHEGRGCLKRESGTTAYRFIGNGHFLAE